MKEAQKNIESNIHFPYRCTFDDDFTSNTSEEEEKEN